MSFILNRDAELYISNATATWNATNTDRLLLKNDFAIRPSVTYTSVNRESINPTGSRTPTVFSAAEGPVNVEFTSYLYAGIPTSFVELTSRKAFQGLAGYAAAYTSYADRAEVVFANSNIARLLATTVWFAFPTSTYRVDDVTFTRAEIDISLTDIAQIRWYCSGKGLTLNDTYAPPTATDLTPYKSCIPNKFTEISLSIGAKNYTLNLLNSKINIDNQISFISRDILGTFTTVNDHYTGDRSITGELGFYLKSIGGVNTAQTLFTDLYTNRSYLEDNTASITISIGGSSNTPRLDIIMPNVYLNLPDTEWSVAASLNVPFIALESTPGAADEITLKYYL